MARKTYRRHGPRQRPMQVREPEPELKHEKKRRPMSEQQKNLLRMLDFLVKLSILAIPLWFIIFFNLQIVKFKEITAGIVYADLKFFGIPAELKDTFLSIPAKDGLFAVNLNWVCSGWESVYIFFALVFATDLALGKKLRAMIYLPFIYLINIFRIISVLLMIYFFGSKWFDILHIAWTFILTTIILWIWWTWLKKDSKSPLL
jgi:exosortase/archaeosortase family protein